MPIISISLVVFNSVRLRSTSLKSGLDNRCRFLRTVSIPDSSFSAIVDCLKNRIKDEKKQNFKGNIKKPELNSVLCSFECEFLESDVHHRRSIDLLRKFLISKCIEPLWKIVEFEDDNMHL